MASILYVLAFLFLSTSFSATHTTYWINNPASQNNTFSNADNWDNGVPMDGSIAYINDTGCSGCTIDFDVPEISLSELHLDAVSTSGPYLNLLEGTHLIVTSHFNLGTVAAAGKSYYYTEVAFRNGKLSFGKDCQAWFIYIGAGTSNFYADSGFNGTIVNNGTVTVKTNTGVTSVGNSYQWGYYQTSGPMYIDNWGNWVANDPNGVVLYFYSIKTFNHYSGSFNSTNYVTSSTSGYSTPTIVFNNADVYFHPGSETTTWFNGPVTFDTDYTLSGSSYPSTLPNKVVIGTDNFVISWVTFSGVNVLCDHAGTWIMDSNFTNYAIINTTTTNNVWLGGTTTLTGDAHFSSLDGTLTVTVDAAATFEHPSSGALYLTGPVTFVNNGTANIHSGADYYWYESAQIVNLGLVDLQGGIVYYSASSFLGTQKIGTTVNRGTIQSTTGGYLYHYTSGSGNFVQCDHGVLKYQFLSTSTDNSGYHKFYQLAVDGWIGVHFDKDYKPSGTYQTLLSYDYASYASTKGVFG